MATTHPALTDQWHPTLNGELKPGDVRGGTTRTIWWQCSQGHDWRAKAADRRKGSGCPYCCNQKVLVGFNDLKTTNPGLATEFHPTLNGELTAENVTARTSKRLWWQCAEGHEWAAYAYARAASGSKCPQCRKATRGQGGAH